MENTQPTHHTKTMLLILATILLLASITGYIVSQNMKTYQGGAKTTALSPVPSVVPTLIPYPTKGTFVLKMDSDIQTAKVGVPFTLNLIANSGVDTVAGYDAILSYDETAFDRQAVQSKSDSFRIFTFERGTHVSVSATKNLQETKQITFSETPILSYTFIAKQKGTYVFSLKPMGNESSKLVNESAQVTYTETADLRLEIN